MSDDEKSGPVKFMEAYDKGMEQLRRGREIRELPSLIIPFDDAENDLGLYCALKNYQILNKDLKLRYN